MPWIELTAEEDAFLEAQAPSFLKGVRKAALRVKWFISKAREEAERKPSDAVPEATGQRRSA